MPSSRPRSWSVTTWTDEVTNITAHRVEVGPSGAVIFWSDPLDGQPQLVLALAPGEWRRVSALDKSAEPSKSGATGASPGRM